MIFANGLDGLSGMGNPSAEMQERSHQSAIFRNLVLIALILSGAILAFLGLMFLAPETDNKLRPDHRTNDQSS